MIRSGDSVFPHYLCASVFNGKWSFFKTDSSDDVKSEHECLYVKESVHADYVAEAEGKVTRLTKEGKDAVFGFWFMTIMMIVCFFFAFICGLNWANCSEENTKLRESIRQYQSGEEK